MAKFYYNGVLLPAIPTEHLATNPFVFIRDDNSAGYYDLIMCSKDLYYADNGVYYNDTTEIVQYMYRIQKSSYLSATEWEFNKEVSNTYFGISSSRVVLWSNSTIYNSSVSSSSIHFPKCELYSDSDKKMMFNDVILPPIPLEYIATNPFVFIRKNNTSGYYDLLLGTSCWYYDSSGVNPNNTSDTQYWYRIPIATADSCTEWEFNQSLSNWYVLDSNRTLLWTLQDISNGKLSSSVYTYGTSPTVLNETLTKYLIINNDTIYTVIDNALVEVQGELNAQLFLDNGVDEIPSGTLLMTLSNPEVLCWTDSDKVPTLTATVKGIPEPQIVVTKEIDLMHSSIKGINGVTVDCKGDVLFAVSFDKKATWMMHNGTEWVAVSDKLAGMTKTEFEAITAEQWQPKYEASSEMYIRCTILDETQSITTLNIDFIN